MNGGARGDIIQNFELLLLDPIRVGGLCAGIRPLCGGEGGKFCLIKKPLPLLHIPPFFFFFLLDLPFFSSSLFSEGAALLPSFPSPPPLRAAALNIFSRG